MTETTAAAEGKLHLPEGGKERKRMRTGAVIEQGLEDWQIIQQSDGKGEIEVSGYWYLDTDEQGSVYVRIVKEDTGETVIPWREAVDTGKQHWKAVIPEIPAGGLYRLETCVMTESRMTLQWGIRGDVVHYFGIGDLYVIAGQSNSAGYGKDPVYDPPELGVHLLANCNCWKLAAHPLNDSTDTRHEINRETANTGNSPYLSFAKYLKRELHYPVGLIQTSLGGSPLSRWNPEEEGDLYKNMLEIAGLAKSGIKGILWYQGCSDTEEPQSKTYFERFQKMVERTRRDLQNQDLAFLTVQLNRCITKSDQQTDEGWSRVREAQRRAAREIRNVFLVPSLDFSLSDSIHNSSASNVVLGERMARLALQKIYGKPVQAMAPDIAGAVLTKADQVTVVFENIYERFYTYDVPAEALSLGVEDELGMVRIRDYRIPNSSECLLNLERPVQGNAYLHNAKGKNPSGTVPIDFATHLPLLGCYRIPVRQI